MTTRADCERLDGGDPLRAFRDRFVLPEGVIYLDGNSLGPLPRATPARVAEVVAREWGNDLIRSWNTHGWIDLPQRVGGKIAKLIGAAADEVIVADSTSVNIFKLLAGAVSLRPGRDVIVSEARNFPTDLYVVEGLASLLDGRVSRRVVERNELASALDERVAVLMLTHTDYRSGEMHDMATLTRAAHDAGALVLWDLAHSAGAMPVDLNGCNADLAVGCGYKYLNGGPGAPAFAFVAKRHHEHIVPALTGWMGHVAPFEFGIGYSPAPGMQRQLCGTPAVLSTAALECGVDLMLEADLDAVRAKSMALTSLFVERVEATLAEFGFELRCPRDAHSRGSQVSFAHANGYAIVQALIERGVIGDFRAPDILRFGFAPLYVRYADVWDAVETLADVMHTGVYQDARFAARAAVT